MQKSSIPSFLSSAQVALPLFCDIRDGVPISVFGMSAGERAHVAAACGKFFVFVTTDYVAARLAVRELNQLTGGGVVHLPAQPDVLSYSRARDLSIPSERAAAIGAIVSGRARGVVTTAEALGQMTCPRRLWADAIVGISKGEEIKLSDATARLVKAGYQRKDLVESPGQWSLRGDILDLYPIGSLRPVRVELWGDFVETIKFIDPDTQKSDGVTDGVTVYPCCEALCTVGSACAAAKAIGKLDTKGLTPDDAARRERMTTELVAELENGTADAALEFVLPYLEHAALADYFPVDALMIYDETKTAADGYRNAEKEHRARYKSLLSTGDVLPRSEERLMTFDEMRKTYARFSQASFSRVTAANLFFEPEKLYNFKCAPMTKYSFDMRELASDARMWAQRGYRVILCGRDSDGVRALTDALAQQGLYVGEIEDYDRFVSGGGGIGLVQRELERGFIYHDERYAVVGSGDIFAAKPQKLSRAPGRIFVQPASGDYVVHYVHGIGKCLGTKRMTTSLGTKDYLEIEYRDGDKLFVPVDQMDLVTKYAGENPRLSKMGGKEFARVKERVKAGVKKMAVDLVALYGARKAGRGHVYAVDDTLMEEFVARFPHRSTCDQTAVTKDLVADLREGKIMDRLLVGDVGYGKTEVALRAAFAVMMEGKQVAMLAPTTILCEQHARTAAARFSEFGIRVASLSRFSTASEQADTLKKLKKGEIDFVCGTHRLLSKDVAFSDLGLLVLDEEQRFGVSDKEKLKAYQNTVNVLTMTATPIPRTLHMSLSGIRDISTLTVPPEDRLPVQTVVTEYSDALARDCILRETSRGGQAFVVYNRVETIDRFAEGLISVLPPEIRVMVCHGQMTESALEESVKRFYDGEADVMISTTIIENGIDLPAANTLIVVHADTFGLSQLYQLRGRVGRSNRLAYAYFTYTPGKILSETADKRLATLMEFTEFGSGFKIAVRDLEIRGAGNVLGAEQHGHMEKVGYDLYCKLLGEAVAEARGEAREEESECQVVMDADAFMPDGYIESAEGRMDFYARIAAIRTRSDRQRLIEEVTDVYGAPPKPVVNLITIGLLKGYGVRLGLQEIRIAAKKAVLTAETLTSALGAAVADKKHGCVLKQSDKILIVFESGAGTFFDQVLRFLVDALAAKKSLPA